MSATDNKFSLACATSNQLLMNVTKPPATTRSPSGYMSLIMKGGWLLTWLMLLTTHPAFGQLIINSPTTA